MTSIFKEYFFRAVKIFAKFIIGFIIIVIGLAIVQIKTILNPPSYYYPTDSFYSDNFSSSLIAERREEVRKVGRELIQDNIFYATDKNYVYYYGELIKGADPSSFYVKDQFRSKDKNNYYYQGEKSTFWSYYGEDILILIFLPFGILLLFLLICFLDYRFPSKRIIFENFYVYLGILLPLYAFWIFPIIFDHFEPYGSLKEPVERYFETAISDYIGFIALSIPLYIFFLFVKGRTVYYTICFINFIFLYIAVMFFEGLGSLG